MKYSSYIQSHVTAMTRVHVVDQLVINWHITEACNYSCHYCYSRWEKGQGKGELFRDEESSRQLLCELYDFFSPGNADNPLSSSLKWDSLRLSFAGGEPLLNPHQTLKIAKVAKDFGFKLSLITNASHLSQEGLEPMFDILSILGVSLDSADVNTCRQIGRVDRAGKVLTLDDHVRTIEKIRAVNPGIVLKINTVVNQLNAQENMTEVIERLKPNKWKILRVLPVVSDELAVSDEQFLSFVERHRHLDSIISAESNKEMTQSYLMVDPHGRFFQNKLDIKTGDSYSYSQPILKCGVGTAFRQISFDVEKFVARYPYFPGEVAA